MTLKIVKENENIVTQKTELSQEQYYTALVEDYKAGEIKFKKVKKYRKQEVEPGNVMYSIKYVKNDMYLYRGNYQFQLEVEAKYIASGKLVNYLLYQLSVQMSKLI